jgi:putative peptide zinc metalloprotease protein
VDGVFELVLPDGSRVAIDGELTLGRTSSSDIQLRDPSISRRHAVLGPGPAVQDAGSSHGTYVDGRRIREQTAMRDGAALRVGDLDLRVERRRAPEEAGLTVTGPAATPAASGRPAVRAGWALKRLEGGQSGPRHVLRDLTTGRTLRLDDFEAAAFRRLDGSRSLAELLADSEREAGPDGPARLATLLATLGEEGFLAGVEPSPRRASRPRREWVLPHAPERVVALYERGGHLLFTAPAYAAMALVAVAGLVAFAAALAGGDASPLQVGGRISVGAAVFVAGRLLVVVAHELAHALTVVSFGRRIVRAGVALLFVFPVAFVDTSETWLETRRRRLATTAAGPLADLVLGGACALAALAAAGTTPGDVFFQIACAGYLGALSNLVPFLDRDGRRLLRDLRED